MGNTGVYGVLNSPIVVALVSIMATAMVTVAMTGIRMLVMLAQLKSDITSVRADITDVKSDPDIMRWSNYGRAVQALNAPHGTNMTGG